MTGNVTTNSSVYRSSIEESESVSTQTGFFTLDIPIAEISANNGMGPSVELKLRHTQFKFQKKGAYGWQFFDTFSKIDFKEKKVFLSSGEVFGIKVSPLKVEFLKPAPLDYFIELTSINNKKCVNVIHNSGIIEVFDVSVVKTYSIIPVSRIITPAGFSVYLNWDLISFDTFPVLKNIKDDRFLNKNTTVHFSDTSYKKKSAGKNQVKLAASMTNTTMNSVSAATLTDVHSLTLTVLDDNAIADGKSSNLVQATVADANGVPLQGVSVHFEYSGGSWDIQTKSDGIAICEIRSTQSGEMTVTASLQTSPVLVNVERDKFNVKRFVNMTNKTTRELTYFSGNLSEVKLSEETNKWVLHYSSLLATHAPSEYELLAQVNFHVQYLIKFSAPDGLVTTIEMEYPGHLLPVNQYFNISAGSKNEFNKIKSIPRVKQLVVWQYAPSSDDSGGPVAVDKTIIDYSYAPVPKVTTALAAIAYNFFGYASKSKVPVSTSPDALDVALGDYEYGVICTATYFKYSKESKALNKVFRCKTEFVYDKFHLLKRRNKYYYNLNTANSDTNYTTEEVIFTYGFAKPDLTTPEQPRNYELPTVISTTWSKVNGDNTEKSKTYELNYDYNYYGNITFAHYPDGSMDEIIYYPIAGEITEEGEVLCPPDPYNYFSGLIKREKHTPATTGYTTPVSESFYIWGSSPTRVEIKEFIGYFIQLNTLTERGSSSELDTNVVDYLKVDYFYNTEKSSQFYSTVVSEVVSENVESSSAAEGAYWRRIKKINTARELNKDNAKITLNTTLFSFKEYTKETKFISANSIEVSSPSVHTIGTNVYCENTSENENPGNNNASNSIVLTASNDTRLANGSAAIRILAKVIDGGGTPQSGVNINFSVATGPVLLNKNSTTDVNGYAYASLVSIKAGTFRVTATADESSQYIDVNFQADSNTADLSDADFNINPDGAVADGKSTNTVTILVKDEYNNPVQMESVRFSVTEGAEITPSADSTDANGQTTALITSNTPGVYDVTVTLKELVVSTTMVSDALTLKPLRIIDTQGNTVDYVYGNTPKNPNLLSSTVNDITEYSNTTLYFYESGVFTDTAIPGTHRTRIIDAAMNTLRITFDAMGNLIRTEYAENDNGGISTKYKILNDNLYTSGLMFESTEHDYRQGETTPVVTNTNYFSYSDWMQLRKIVGSDGITTEHYYNSVNNTLFNQEQQNEYSELYDVNTPIKKSSSLLSEYDIAGNLMTITRNKPDGSQADIQYNYTYDGLGRLMTVVDYDKNKMAFSYDFFDRLITTHRPDDSIEELAYQSVSPAPYKVVVKKDRTDTGTTVGIRTLDGLQRTTSATIGGRQYSYQYDSANQPFPSQAIKPDDSVLETTYDVHLDNAPLTIRDVTNPDNPGILKIFNYHPRFGWILDATDYSSSIKEEFDWDMQGLLSKTMLRSGTGTTTSEKITNSMEYSLRGMLVSATTSSNGVDVNKRTWSIDSWGRQNCSADSYLTSNIKYDELNRISELSTKKTDVESGVLLDPVKATYTYDGFSNIERIRYDVGESSEDGVLMLYSYDNKQRITKAGYLYDSPLQASAEYNYEYDNLGHLVHWSENDTNAYVTYKYDPLGNITYQSLFEVTETSSVEISHTDFFYPPVDPCQLHSYTTTFSNPDTPPQTVFMYYNLNGCLVSDSRFNNDYDIFDRAGLINNKQYKYSPHDKLVCTDLSYINNVFGVVSESVTTSLQSANIYSITGSSVTGINSITYKVSSSSSADSTIEYTSTTGYITDLKGTVISYIENGQDIQSVTYTAWGEYSSNHMFNAPAFNGEMAIDTNADFTSDTVYPLGNGYRNYRPALFRFDKPDSESPFGSGGINYYAYCDGDPVNNQDPSGHALFNVYTTDYEDFISYYQDANVLFDIKASIESTLEIADLVTGIVTLGAKGSKRVMGKFKSANAFDSNKFRTPPAFYDVKKNIKKGRVPIIKNNVVVMKKKVTMPDGTSKTQKLKWHKVIHKSKLIYGADQIITGSSVFDALAILNYKVKNNRAYPRKTVLLSGTHGNEYGDNYIGKRYKHIIRNPNLAERDFYRTDKKRMGIIGNLYPNLRIEVEDMQRMNIKTIGRIFNDRKHNVIMSFCFGRNDEALRYFTGSAPVVSYL